MSDLCQSIRQELLQLADPEYGAFMAALVPNVPSNTVVGVRTPQLRSLAKEYSVRPDIGVFLRDLPHSYFEENQLHGFLLERIREYDIALAELERFLPFINNWATCDQTNPKILIRRPERFLERIRAWLSSEHPYTVRFGIESLMRYFLDTRFEPGYLELVRQAGGEDYYIRMMKAWFFATALAKQYDAAVPVLEHRLLEPWTHNKAIQKAVESSRISPERKAYLRTLRVKI